MKLKMRIMTTLLGLVFGCGIAASQTPRAEQTMNSKRQYIAEVAPSSLRQNRLPATHTLWLLNRKELFTASAVYISLNRTNYTITYRTARWKYQIDYTSPNILYFVH